MGSRVAARLTDDDPRDVAARQMGAAIRHDYDPKVPVLMTNRFPDLAESQALPPCFTRSLYQCTQALTTQGYFVGTPIRLTNVRHGNITLRECYVLPYTTRMARSEQEGLDCKVTDVYKAQCAMTPSQAAALWVGLSTN